MTYVFLLLAVFTVVPTAMYFWNIFHFRRPSLTKRELETISILIPARNEAHRLPMTLLAILQNEHQNFEVVILNDNSSDATATIVHDLAIQDQRVRLINGKILPSGWAGKQFACFQLAQAAKHSILLFLDADVVLSRQGIGAIVNELTHSQAAIISGFPKQETVSVLEKLLMPLIHNILLCYLPIQYMRKSIRQSFGVGCGQLFATYRQKYLCVGGHFHPYVRNSFHDGIQLPRAYREHGQKTDIFDATQLAVCRMYESNIEVLHGLAKNASEGLGKPRNIIFASIILISGQVVPIFLLVALVVSVDFGHWSSQQFNIFGLPITYIILLMIVVSYLPRFDAVLRFHQSYLAALFHPIAILIFVQVQWYALIRKILGYPVGWKGRIPNRST